MINLTTSDACVKTTLRLKNLLEELELSSRKGQAGGLLYEGIRGRRAGPAGHVGPPGLYSSRLWLTVKFSRCRSLGQGASAPSPRVKFLGGHTGQLARTVAALSGG